MTRLGQTIGRLFQTTFPPLPEFQGRQVVTLHNQRDFLFFRRHRCVWIFSPWSKPNLSVLLRYAFRSPERVALQEIGPRFTLKLRWLKKGIPAVQNFGEEPKPLAFDVEPSEVEEKDASAKDSTEPALGPVIPPKTDEYLWAWKVHLVFLP